MATKIGPHAGAVIISIDFELRWGMRHVLGDASHRYDGCIRRAPQAAALLLDELLRRKLRATWAAVGALACSGWDEYWARAPDSPAYADTSLRIGRAIQRLDPTGELHFCRPELLSIANAPGQELGCHTFSHLLCGRPGSTVGDLDRDLSACTALWQELFGRGPVSFVYPCNEQRWTARLSSHGVRVVRTAARGQLCGSIPFGRLMGAALDVVRRPLSHVPSVGAGGIIETEGSRFVRFGLPIPLSTSHFERAIAAVRALEPGRVLHFWWHPHNLGRDPRGCVDQALPLLDCIARGVEAGRIRSLRMADLASGAT
jgi:hypothetical protein